MPTAGIGVEESRRNVVDAHHIATLAQYRKYSVFLGALDPGHPCHIFREPPAKVATLVSARRMAWIFHGKRRRSRIRLQFRHAATAIGSSFPHWSCVQVVRQFHLHKLLSTTSISHSASAQTYTSSLTIHPRPNPDPPTGIFKRQPELSPHLATVALLPPPL